MAFDDYTLIADRYPVRSDWLEAMFYAASQTGPAEEPYQIMLFGDSTSMRSKDWVHILCALIGNYIGCIPGSSWNTGWGPGLQLQFPGPQLGVAPQFVTPMAVASSTARTVTCSVDVAADQPWADAMCPGTWVVAKIPPINAWDFDNPRQVVSGDYATKTLTVSEDWAANPVTAIDVWPEHPSKFPPGTYPIASTRYASAGMLGLYTCARLLDTAPATAAWIKDSQQRVRIGVDLAAATMTAQIVAGTRSNFGTIAWSARPVATATLNKDATLTASGTISDARLTSAEWGAYRLADLPLPLAAGASYAQLRLDPQSSYSYVELVASVRFLSDLDRRGFCLSPFAVGGYEAGHIATRHGDCGAVLTAMGGDGSKVLVIYHLGLNNANHGVTSICDTAEEYQAKVLADVAVIRAALPQCGIIFLVPYYRAGVASPTEYAQYGGALKAIVDATPNTALINQRKILETYGWDAAGYATYLSDGVHKKTSGERLQAEVIFGEILKMAAGEPLDETLAAIAAKTANLPDDTATTLAALATTVGSPMQSTDGERNAIAAAVVAGTDAGARTITVHVTDGTSDLQNATVRLTEGASSYTQTTDADGEATFNLDDATYAIACTKAGYSYAGGSAVVTADATVEVEMTQIVESAPAAPGKVYMDIYAVDGAGDAQEGIVITARLKTGPGTSGYAWDRRPWQETTSDTGRARFEVAQNTTWLVRRGNGPEKQVSVTTTASPPEILGEDYA
jgi:hypothetical protein